ncbi:MAG: M48 family metalloprotease [Gammaproteobacteria bacterium]|nr:M48 family metalloprotease [Gammaproteobacteria bacterium]
MLNKNLVHILLLLCLPAAAPTWAARDNVGAYLEKYGRADPENPLVQKIEAVFKRVRAVADKPLKRPPKLSVVKKGNAWAAALPDGYIVLPLKTAEICYHNVDEETGNARLAFVLAHELAHLANGDFWHKEFFDAVKPSEFPGLLQEYRDKSGKEKEVAADDHGFIYAAMAGYPVDRLIEEKRGNENFFLYWQQQAPAQANSPHPDPHERAKFLRIRLQKLLQEIHYFDFGVRLAHFSRCKDALYFLERFQRSFAGREVLNNIGFCKLQLARKELKANAWLYWMPMLLDTVTQAEALGSSSGDLRSITLNREAELYLNEAKENFHKAVKTDPCYAPAWVNLAVTELYLNELYMAQAAVKKAREQAPDNLEIQGLDALILYETGLEADTWPLALTRLKTIAAKDNAPSSVLYNTARLLEKRGRAEAKTVWQHLAKRASRLPAPIRRLVCQKQTCQKPDKQARSRLWKTRLTPGAYLETEQQAGRLLKNWAKHAFNLAPQITGTICQHPDGLEEVLELEGYLELIILKKVAVPVDALPQYCQSSVRETPVTTGTLISCPRQWSALVTEGKIKEVWLR